MATTSAFDTDRPAEQQPIAGISLRLLTAPQPRRAFQGWRYLKPADAPPDLNEAGGEDMPVDLAKQLRELGAW